MRWPLWVLAALALLQTLRLWWRERHKIRSLRTRSRRAIAGEDAAEPLLRRLGYDILDRQSTGSWSVRVAGEERQVVLRADYLVERRGRRLIADVKTGRLAPRIESAATRRQLLEYRLAFDVDGVLLVDVEAELVAEVEFPLAEPTPPWDLRLYWLATGILLGLLAGLLR
jgi:hypothetical protein